MNVLVTGGAGFIGSHVIRHLVDKGHRVVCLDDLSGGFTDNISPKAQFVNGTIVDTTFVNGLFEKNNFDYVFHLAAYAAEGLSHFIKKFNYMNNLVGSVNLINASVNHNVKCFVFASSIAVYGKGQLPMTEEMVPLPEDPYGIAKYAIELDLKESHDMFGLNYIVFRPHNVYGEHQNIGDKYRNVVGIFMNQILQGLPLTIFGDGKQTRAFSYVGDVAPIIADSVDVKNAYNQVFNVGADIPYTVNNLAEVVATSMGVEDCKIKYLPARNEVIHAYSDHSKIQHFFNYNAHTSLEDGVASMAAWVKQFGARKSKRFENVEVEKNFPAGWLD